MALFPNPFPGEGVAKGIDLYLLIPSPHLWTAGVPNWFGTGPPLMRFARGRRAPTSKLRTIALTASYAFAQPRRMW